MIRTFEKTKPEICDSCFVAESSELIGNIKLSENVSIWHGSVLRGDINSIEIGKNTNIQDMSVIHVDLPTKENDHKGATLIGENVTIGHRALLHACTIKNNCLIGMGAIILSGAVIGEGSIVAAGAVVRENQEIPPNSLVAGVPGKIKATVNEEMSEKIKISAQRYVALANRFIQEHNR